MKFSIIIPARNEEGYLARTLKSIENQNYPHYETIVVLNGCTDNTLHVANKYADEIITCQPGVSKARNSGAKKATGDILVFLDADTILNSNILKEIKKRFSQKYSVGTIKVRPDIKKLKYKFMMGFKNTINELKIYPWTTGIMYCRKNEFSEFNENLHVRETYFFTKKMMQKGKFQFLNNTFVETSMRRFKKYGSLRLVSFFLKKGIKTIVSKIDGDKYPIIR